MLRLALNVVPYKLRQQRYYIIYLAGKETAFLNLHDLENVHWRGKYVASHGYHSVATADKKRELEREEKKIDKNKKGPQGCFV